MCKKNIRYTLSWNTVKCCNIVYLVPRGVTFLAPIKKLNLVSQKEATCKNDASVPDCLLLLRTVVCNNYVQLLTTSFVFSSTVPNLRNTRAMHRLTLVLLPVLHRNFERWKDVDCQYRRQGIYAYLCCNVAYPEFFKQELQSYPDRRMGIFASVITLKYYITRHFNSLLTSPTELTNILHSHNPQDDHRFPHCVDLSTCNFVLYNG